MSRLLVLSLVVLAAALSGCAGATRTLDSADGAALGNALDGRSGTVVLLDGGRFPARALRMDADTTSWFDVASGEILAVPTSAIAEVQRRDRGRSAGRTAKAGALVLGAVGATLFAAAGYDSGGCILWCDTPTQGERLSAATTFGLVGGLMSAGTGAFYGAIGGAVANTPDRYVLAPAPEAQSEAVAEVEVTEQ